MTKKKFDLSGFAKMMEGMIRRLENLIDGDAILERNEALDICAKHLIEAAAILRDAELDDHLSHELALLETVIRMVQDEIVE